MAATLSVMRWRMVTTSAAVSSARSWYQKNYPIWNISAFWISSSRNFLSNKNTTTTTTTSATTANVTSSTASPNSSTKSAPSSSASSNLSNRHHSSSSLASPPSFADSFVTRSKVNGFELSTVGDLGNGHPRPLVVLISWLNAQDRHLRKYQELYWQRGFDILTMAVHPMHVVRPRRGIKYVAKLLKILQENKELNNRQVIFHGFSIGAFMYTQLQLLLQHQQQEQQNFHPVPGELLQDSYDAGRDLSSRIAGLVLDSPAYTDNMCEGIANSVTENVTARSLITNSLLLYLAAFPKSVQFHYDESLRMFHDNSVPTLILYSKADIISSAVTSERYVNEWRQKGYPVFTKQFETSTHVTHFQKYPNEYVEALDLFLDKLPLQDVKVMDIDESAEAAAAEI